MTGLPHNVEELLNRLTEDSRNDLNLVRTLADAIRRVDDQLLQEVRAVTVQHEARREAILEELHTLATRLCTMPAKPLPPSARPAIEYQKRPTDINSAPPELPLADTYGGDWRQAAQNIPNDADFEFDIPPPAPRH